MTSTTRRPVRIVVDLTALSPGGQNGGSGLVATSLVRELRHLAPEWELILLTSSDSHPELAALDAHNVRRICVLHRRSESPGAPGLTKASHTHVSGSGSLSPVQLRGLLVRAFDTLPPRARVRARNALWRVRYERRNAQLLHKLNADLVVCPFTAITYWYPRIPLVAIVHDLQHLAYPQFFSVEQRLNRDAQIRLTRQRATRVVCVSEFVRQTLVAYLPSLSTTTTVIPNGRLHQWCGPGGLEPPLPGIEPGAYLLYPANFWPHKNHRVLFEAFRRFRQSTTPTSSLKLVCTGAPNARMADLRSLADTQLEPGTVLFPGHVDEDAFRALLDNCAALVYPSVYEGFGMPVLEAMSAGKPVLCSRIGSLEEVAGAAAYYFDPTDPEDIAQSIRSLTDDPDGALARVALGRDRARAFGTAADMARSYMTLFEDVLDAEFRGRAPTRHPATVDELRTTR